ncbi:MAG: autotransporter domain-containing protein [Proteobacteria bacterium]|nr:autotransporter domain-containing protein [Pseudomonadota bacterium]
MHDWRFIIFILFTFCFLLFPAEGKTHPHWYVTFSGSSNPGINDILSLSPHGKDQGFILPSTHGLKELRGMAVGPEGGFYVANAFHKQSKILRFESPSNPNFVSNVATPQVSSGLLHPYAIAFSPEGNLYTSSQDTNVVSCFVLQGTSSVPGGLSNFLQTTFPQGTFNPGTFVPASSALPPPCTPVSTHHGGLTLKGRHSVRGIAFGPNGQLFVADEAKDRVLFFDTQGVLQGKITDNHLKAPVKVIFNMEDGHVYIGSSKTHRIYRYHPSTQKLEEFIDDSSKLKDVSGLGFDDKGNLYAVSRTKRTISIYDSKGNFKDTFAKNVNFTDDIEDILPIYPQIILNTAQTQNITSSTTLGFLGIQNPAATLTIAKEVTLKVRGSGFTTLSAGQLNVEGTLNGYAVLLNGGTVSGNGTIQLWSTFFNNQGILSPNNLTLIGNYRQGPQGTLAITTSATPSSSPSLVIQGNATLDGDLLISSSTEAPSLEMDTLPVLVTQNGTISGQFASAVYTNSVGTVDCNTSTGLFQCSVIYKQNEVDVVLNRRPFMSLMSQRSGAKGRALLNSILAVKAGQPTTLNLQKSNAKVGATLDSILEVKAGKPLTKVVHALDLLSLSQVQEALDQLHVNNQAHFTSVSRQSYSLVNDQIQSQLQSLRQDVLEREKQASSSNSSFAALATQTKNSRKQMTKFMSSGPRPREHIRSSSFFHTPTPQTQSIFPEGRYCYEGSSVWIQSFGQGLQRNKTSEVVGMTAETFGTALGADQEIFKNIFFGLTGGFSRNTVHLKENRGTGDINNYYAGFYGMTVQGPFYINGNVILGQDRYHKTRNINFLGQTAKSRHSGFSVSTWWETGYGVDTLFLTFTPFGQVGYVSINEKGYTEQGSDANLKIGGKNSHFIQTQVGVHIDHIFRCADVLIKPDITLAWLYKGSLGHTSRIKQSFAALNNPSFEFTTAGDNKKLNQFAPSLSTVVQFKNGFFLAGDIGAEIGSGERVLEGFIRTGINF